MRNIQNTFIARKYSNTKTEEIVAFDKLLNNQCSIILGEPASGKTFQLKQFQKDNKKVHFIDLIVIRDEEINVQDIDTVLIDSIDESLVDDKEPKILISKLRKYINEAKKQNPHIKFVITSRYLEWNQYFQNELDNLFETLEVFRILDIEIESINILLKNNNINIEEFWNFINKNYLGSLLKNILVASKLIDNFENYKNNTQTNYIEIYKDIVMDSLSSQGEERDFIVASPEKYFIIASNLATYMMLNRKYTISYEELPKLCDQLYKIDNRPIELKDLKLLLNTTLFQKQKDNQFDFIHKSVKEYLVACFVDYKRLNEQEIKSLFAKEDRFYEEFEEVLVYLTNIKEDLFGALVGFDPFVFRRHNHLVCEQQVKLLDSIVNILNNNKTFIWGRWDYFEDTTIVKLNKINNIEKILESLIELKDIDNVLLPYILHLLKYNYTENFQKYVFEILNYLVVDKQELVQNILRNNFIEIYEFNSSLFHFLKHYNLFKQKSNSIFSFEVDLFCNLYGITYKNRYDDERKVNRSNFSFTELIYLIDLVSEQELQYIAPYLTLEDSKTWFSLVRKSYDSIQYTDEYISWVIFAMLNNYEDIKTLKQIVSLLDEHSIYIHHVDYHSSSITSKKIIKDYFDLYFNDLLGDSFYINILMSILNISYEDIQQISKVYDISMYTDKYVKFRLLKDVDKFLMQNIDFEKYMQELWKKQKQQNEEIEKKYSQRSKESTYKKNFDAICEKSKELKITDDYYNLYFCCKNKDEDINNLLDATQKEHFKNILKQDFISDESYLELKQTLISNNLSNRNTFLFAYLFSELSNEEITSLIDSVELFAKIFWHHYKYNEVIDNDVYIILLRDNYYIFVDLIIESIELSLHQSDNTQISNLFTYIGILKKINKFHKQDLEKLLLSLSNLCVDILIKMEDIQQKYLFEILLIDNSNYDLIKKIMLVDKSNFEKYFLCLLKINVNCALEDFFEMYDKHAIYKVFQENKPTNYFLITNQNVNFYDHVHIEKSKIALYKKLIISLKTSNVVLYSINSDFYRQIIVDYYTFFKPYKTPECAFTSDSYYSMNSFIGDIWNMFGSTESYIPLLKELITDADNIISSNAKYSYNKAVNNHRKIDNDVYKKIFNKEEVMKENRVVNIANGQYIENNHGTVSLNNKTSDEVANPKWYNNWMFISFVFSAVGAIILYLMLHSFIVTGVGFVLIFIVTNFFNPKRRFFRMASSTLAVGILELISFDWIVKNINTFFDLNIQSHSSSNIVIGLVLILASMYLFYLDYKENKNRKD